MKRTSHLFLLVPSLFLLASCQTTPKVDTIDEKEAQAFIQEHYNKKELKDFTKPDDNTTFSWEIIDTKDQTGIDEAKEIVKKYVGITDDIELKKDNVKITSGYGQSYLNELTSDEVKSFDTPVGDAVIGMNWKDIYQKLYSKSAQNDDDHDLFYKKGPDNGLIIISRYMGSKIVHTRTHTYNSEGLESKFEVACSMYDSKLQYKLTIDFRY